MISPQSSTLDGPLRDFFASEPVSSLPSALADSSAESRLAAFQRIVEITSEVFGQEPEIIHDHNPEFPQEKCIVLTVRLPPDRTLMLEKEAAWTRQTAAVEPKLDMVRLSIKPHR